MQLWFLPCGVGSSPVVDRNIKFISYTYSLKIISKFIVVDKCVLFCYDIINLSFFFYLFPTALILLKLCRTSLYLIS